MATLKVGIVGVGNMGSAHASTISGGKVNGMQLAALCDINPERAAFLRETFPVPVYTDFDEMLESEQLDAVIVATPHYSHCELAEKALARGLHILVEKPMSVRTSEAEHLAEIAKSSDKVFAIMFNQRTNELFRRAKKLISDGELGKIKKSVWIITNWYRTQAYYDSGSWRATWRGEGGGVLMNQAPHQLDLWQWILGMPENVTAFGSVAKYHNIEVEDDATVVTTYADGGLGIFTTSTGEFPGTNRLEISGTLGKIVLEDGLLKHWRLREDEEKFRFSSKEGFAKIPFDYSETAQDESENGHLSILQNFADAILSGAELIAPGIQGVNEITLANAAYLSMWTGKTVSLPLDCCEFNAELAKRISTSETGKKSGEDGGTRGEYSERWQVRW